MSITAIFRSSAWLIWKNISRLSDLVGNIDDLPLIQKLRGSFSKAEPIYLVGGAIRDHLMGLEIADIDLCCSRGIKTGREIADRFGFDIFIMDKERDVCRVIETHPDGRRSHYDISGFRGESIDQDLLGRDVTINAIAYEIFSGKVIDSLGGAKDIRQKTLKACSKTSMQDDPLRVLRVARFANAFKFRVDEELIEQIKQNVPKLAFISSERVRDEFVKLICGPRPHIGIQLLDNLGILKIIHPKLLALKGVEQPAPHVQDVWFHTLSVLNRAREVLDLTASEYNEGDANADVFNGLVVLKLGSLRGKLMDHFSQEVSNERPRSEVLLLSALYHDIGKPNTRSVDDDGRIRFLGHDALSAAWAKDWLTAAKFSNTEIDLIEKVILFHMRFHALVNKKLTGKPITDRNIYKFFNAAGAGGVENVLLGLADTRATYEHNLTHEVWRSALDVAESLLNGYFNRQGEVIEPPLFLDGNALMKDFDLKPGPIIGKILDRLKEEQASGTVQTLESANELVSAILNEAKETGN